MQPSEIITVNIWQIVVSLLNLLILFLIIKKFLYKPVKNMLKSRQENVDRQYSEASEHLARAERKEEELNEQLSSAEQRAEEMLEDATVLAQKRGERIVDEARQEAQDIIRQARNSAEMEKKRVQGEIKEQIVDVSIALSEKLIEREIKEEDHHTLIESFISQIGEGEDEE